VTDKASAAAAEPDMLSALLDHLPAGMRESLTPAFDIDPQQFEWLGDESGRIAGNLLLLLERGWPEMTVVIGQLVVYALAWALAVGVAAAVVGWVLYLAVFGQLLRRGWRTGRLLGCFTATVVVLCAGAGGGWAGLALGAGRAMEDAIEHRYVVERLAAATFLAFALDEGEDLREVDPEAVKGLLDSAQQRSAESWSAFRSHARAAGADANPKPSGWLRAELMVGAVEKLSGDGAPDLSALHGILLAPAIADAGDRLPQTLSVRRRAVSMVRGAVYTQVATGLGFGLALPLVGLGLLGLVGSLVHRSSRPPEPTF
jgi:hypothetical protein